MVERGLGHDGRDGQATPRRILANPSVSARRLPRGHGIGRFSVRRRCRWFRRRTSHATRGVGESVARERGDDHVSHDPARSWGGHLPASVFAPARRGRCPDRLEDLLRRRRDSTRVGPTGPMADGRGFPGWRLHAALHPRWRRSLSGDRGCSVHLFRHRDERTVRVGGRSARTHPRRARRFRRIGGVRRTKADDRRYPCRVLPCDRRFGGDVSPSGVVLLPERTLALSLRWGRRRSRDDGRGDRRIGGRGRRRLRRVVQLTEGTLTLRGRLG